MSEGEGCTTWECKSHPMRRPVTFVLTELRLEVVWVLTMLHLWVRLPGAHRAGRGGRHEERNAQAHTPRI